MIDEIKQNVNTEIAMLREISNYSKKLKMGRVPDKRLLTSTVKSLIESMIIMNNVIPELVSEIKLTKSLPASGVAKKKQELEKVTYKRADGEFNAIVSRKNRGKLLKELSISEGYIRKLKKKDVKFGEKYEEFKSARGYLKFSNKLFLNTAIKWINKGYFKKLAVEIKRANLDILFQTYVAMIFTTTFLSIFVGIFITVFLMFFNFHLSWPITTLFSGDYFLRLLKVFWIPIVTPVVVFGMLYFYPMTEKKSVSKKINQELPFAVVHMSAISGSGIQPSEIFRIIGLSKEYPYLRKEIRKVLNQINLYGYDLVTSLTNVSKSTPSNKLSELFSGLSTTIHSGGSLTEFFEKRAETLLIGYRLERQKYIKTAETFMDIYISVVIAAPMILMLLLIIMNIANFSIGLSSFQMTALIISIVALINTVFLVFLHLNQPSY